MRDTIFIPIFSYDSEADFCDYLDHYEGEIVTTEHYDLSNPYPYEAAYPMMMYLTMRPIQQK